MRRTGAGETMRTTQKRHVCVLLPNKRRLDCTVRVRARGHEVLNSVLQQLGLSDLQVFRLAVLRDNEYLFLDLEQKLSRYFGRTWNRGSLMVPFILFLRVHYYVESGRLILSSEVRRLYYAELRQKVLRSQSRRQEALLFQVAAFALQAEVGDERGGDEEEEEEEEEGEEKRHYFLPEEYFPSWLIKRRGRDFLLRHGPVLHAELRGVPRSQAVLQFIREASGLQDGPVTFYRMRQEKKELRNSILLGVALKGVHIYQEVEGKRCPLYNFTWTDIDRFTFQGSRFEIAAVGSLCLPKLVYYTPSAFHSKHILRHLGDSHRMHMNTRAAVSYVQHLEDTQASQLYREAYICDRARLARRLQGNSLTSSTSDCREEEEEEEKVSITGQLKGKESVPDLTVAEFELCVDEPEEFLVDDPAEVGWLAELLHGGSVDGPLVLPSSCWAAVTMEMKQVLRRRADEGVPVD